MMTVKRAAELMGISDSLVYELCASGSLPHIRLGRPGRRGCIRLDPADINAFLASQKICRVAQSRALLPQQKPFRHVVIR
jgi:excisionase family DNA binding protein